MIAIPQLASFRSRTLDQRDNGGSPDAATWANDLVLLRGLGLGLHETLAFLTTTSPSLEQFEAWILERNGGSIEPERMERINAAIDGRLAELGPDEALEPVLSAEDLAFWDEHGYVVLHDAVPPEQLRAAEEAIWSFLGMDPDDAATWYGRPHGHSIWVPLLQHPALWANRRAPRIRSAFAQLWRRSDLWVTVDQAGMNPPETETWRFPGPHLHFDVSLVPPVPFGTLGILYLTDTAADQGAFTCVPGFHKTIDAWLGSFPPGTNPRDFDLTQLDARPIAGRAGDLIIWHQALPARELAQSRATPRVVQYIAMSPSGWEERTAWK